jgi:hypothetical protein
MNHLKLIIISILLVGCANSARQMERIPKAYLASDGRLKINLISELAEKVALRHGHKLENYLPPKINHENSMWAFFFEAKEPCLGCFFDIYINEKDLTTFYSPGR